MKKLFNLTLILISLAGSAQKKDTIKVDSLTADTKFISLSDVSRVLEGLDDKITVSQSKTFTVIFQAIVQQLAKEYYDKPKKP